MSQPPPRILFVDAYDSFSNNIITLLSTELKAQTTVIKIDDPRFISNNGALISYLQNFDAVIAGPGPGHPANASDVGLIARLWDLPEESLLPVLGICFGFQSLALHFGGRVERLREPRHGFVTPVTHCGRDVFADTGELIATQYHSLHVRLDPDDSARGSGQRWAPSKTCKELVPLAWDTSDTVNGDLLMAVRHCHKPFWGVQYHPESVCTTHEGRKLVANWWSEVLSWWAGRGVTRNKKRDSVEPCSDSGTMLEHGDSTTGPEAVFQPHEPQTVKWRKVALRDDVTIPQLVDFLRTSDAEPFVLESGMRNGKPVNSETGRFSMIGVHDKQSTHIQYSICTRMLNVVANGVILSSQQATIDEVFAFLKLSVRSRDATGGAPCVPFWGGLIGFISYEAGLQTINVVPPATKAAQPDVWFVFVERSVVIDHVERVAYVQSLRVDDNTWLSDVVRRITEGRNISDPSPSHSKERARIVARPEATVYCDKVLQCQAHLGAGTSYELCLTDTTLLATTTDPWHLYLGLRNSNPAPFGAYLRLTAPNISTQGISILSSSPERFLTWSREGECQFRPIKGTVRKTAGLTRAKAEELLDNSKERAENLMIVDLIRHDLSGVPSVKNVNVPKLMQVEEYETVFQLVSVIEGEANAGCGIDVLAASLPPGSMTGAPKKRSCELLREIEARPRGLYSGVLGYLDVGGGGDFSVVIRSAFKWDDEGDWRVGAGGAVTSLSDPQGEWEEMVTKRESVLSTFRAAG